MTRRVDLALSGRLRSRSTLTALISIQCRNTLQFDGDGRGQCPDFDRSARGRAYGVYDTLYTPRSHWTEYACRSLAHNTLLVFDPHQVFAEGYGNDGGQNVLRGFQHHQDWQTYLAHYRKERLDTAEVFRYAFDERHRYGYLHCDLTCAYGDKVTACDRQFVYLPANDFLVVYDRVTAARPELIKRSLLHFQELPSIDGVAPRPGLSSFRGARMTSVRRSGQLVSRT